VVVRNLDADDNANDGQDDEEYYEADPTLSTGRSCRRDSFFRVAKTMEGER
jgi:hypothetical protein